ncbi:hypothetical protein ACJBU6_01589 [Exserohilum turcicum]
MRTTLALANALLCVFVHAQSPVDMFPGSMMTCQSGYAPSLTCSDPVPVDELCSCTCRDGATFNQSRPSPSDIVVPPPTLEPARQLVEKPCTTEVITPWTEIRLPHERGSPEPSEMFSNIVNLMEDSFLAVADSNGRCQHFEVYIDDELIGETYGTGELDNTNCGRPEQCMEDFGGSHGYFTLPKGQHTIGLRWVKVSEICKEVPVGIGSYQIYRPC